MRFILPLFVLFVFVTLPTQARHKKSATTTGRARKFYIIGHNPNTPHEALLCLLRGANALEPDVHYDAATNQFYVYDSRKKKDHFTLDQYLDSLKSGIEDYNNKHLKGRATLALMAFDLKPSYPDFKIVELFKKVREHFSTAPYNKISILTTINNPVSIDLFNSIKNSLNDNEAVGVDQRAKDPAALNSTFRNMNVNSYTYATGRSILNLGFYTRKINNAVQLRESGNSFKLVYAWTVNSRFAMKKYLNIDNGIDGMITDNPRKLFVLLMKYRDKYVLATPDDHPFR